MPSILFSLLIVFNLFIVSPRAQECIDDVDNYDTGKWIWRGCNYGQYDPHSDNEVAKDCPSPRFQSIFWNNGTHFHLFGGNGPGNNYTSQPSGILNDHWVYDLNTHKWIEISENRGGYNRYGVYGNRKEKSFSNYPGSRKQSVVWQKNGLVYMFGGFGFAKSGQASYLNDLWEYNSSSNIWTWIDGNDYVNSDDNITHIGARCCSVSWVDGNDLYLFSGYGVYDSENMIIKERNDVWLYSLEREEWYFVQGNTKFNDPLSELIEERSGTLMWVDEKNDGIWVHGGYNSGNNTYFSDTWFWNKTETRWIKKSLNTYSNKNSIIANERNIPSPLNLPSSRCCSVTWIDRDGNMFLYGGYGIVDDNGTVDFLNDVWAMKAGDENIKWIYIRENDNKMDPIYGYMNTSDSFIWPGSRAYANYWYNRKTNTLWLFGSIGRGNDKSPWIYYQDLWTYDSPLIVELVKSDEETKPRILFRIIFSVIGIEVFLLLLIGIFIIYKGYTRSQKKNVFTERMKRLSTIEKDNNNSSERENNSSGESSITPQNVVTLFDWGIKKKELKFGQVIGCGSSGIIYKGKWRHQNVAIKKLAVEGLIGEREGALKEVQMVMNLRPHLNVIRILGVCVTENEIFIVMNLMHTSLDKLLYESKEKLSKKDMYTIIKGIVAGMIHLENEKICHRDLASRNICLDKDKVPAITDFGMSRKIMSSKEGETSTQMGPVAWMAPECFKQIYSTKSDVWSFGCVLYEILMRKKPHYECENLFELAIQIRDMGKVPKLDDERNHDPTLVRIMKKCWEYNPEDRPTFKKIGKILERKMKEEINDINSNILIDKEEVSNNDVVINNVTTKDEYVNGFY